MKIAKKLLRSRDHSREASGGTDPPQCGPQPHIDGVASRPALKPIRAEMNLLQGRILNGTRFGILSERPIPSICSLRFNVQTPSLLVRSSEL